MKIYNDLDIANAYRSGYWIGTVVGVTGMFLLCLLVGIYLV